MANAEQLALLKKSVGDWNKSRDKDPKGVPDLREADLIQADLAGSDLSGADLVEAKLGGAILREADLRRANLREADFFGADLGRTKLSGARLWGSDFRQANLTRANLTRAGLLGANLTRACLDGAKMSEANVGGTIFGDVDLDVVEGLGTVHHNGPSVIGLDTILKSGGKIPDEFLRGCGVDPLIQKILMGDGEAKTDAFYAWISRQHNPLQRCFISYATEDKSFVDRLQRALNERGVDYWYAPEHGRWGEELHRQIDLEISLRDRMLLVCSEDSLKKDWVAYEIERAIIQEEKRGSRVIFPIMIDSALLAWNHPRATRIRDVLAADFRKATKGKLFEEQLARLLEALGYSDSTKA